MSLSESVGNGCMSWWSMSAIMLPPWGRHMMPLSMSSDGRMQPLQGPRVQAPSKCWCHTESGQFGDTARQRNAVLCPEPAVSHSRRSAAGQRWLPLCGIPDCRLMSADCMLRHISITFTDDFYPQSWSAGYRSQEGGAQCGGLESMLARSSNSLLEHRKASADLSENQTAATCCHL